MKHTLLKEAQENPDKQFLKNQDHRIGESIICSLNDLRELPYIDNDEQLLELDIVEINESKIEITESINKKLAPFSAYQRKELLRRAWDACNDGAWLESEYTLDYDPWDGEHEEKRKEIEEDAIDSIIYWKDL